VVLSRHGVDALRYSEFYGGKVELSIKVPIRGLEDFSVWYTPGVAEVCRAIMQNKDASFKLTNRWNTILIATDGSRVLGLGDIGPEASLPVMEGKSLIFKYLGGVDAIPLPVRSSTPDELISVIKALEPAVGGVNLEDISSPDCFYVQERLSELMEVPVWHDDQLGTASVVLAALINALKIVGKHVSDVRIVFLGAGASNIATANLLIKYGFDPGKMILIDSRGALHADRSDIDVMMTRHRWKYELALKTNRDRIDGGLTEALEGADVLIAASRPGPGIITKEQIALMSSSPVVFSLANPVPEIWPWEAKDAGAAVVATGRPDFPNQVNNSLAFPAVFRGALDVRASRITPESMIAAANELAKCAEERGLSNDYIVPTMEEWEIYPRVAAAVAESISRQGNARTPLKYEEELEQATKIITRSRKIHKLLMDNEIIQPPPP
jgi:malate dehydrogenase (oxaloacetate-decarboxylating)